jgi:hypothetical protein
VRTVARGLGGLGIGAAALAGYAGYAWPEFPVLRHVVALAVLGLGSFVYLEWDGLKAMTGARRTRFLLREGAAFAAWCMVSALMVALADKAPARDLTESLDHTLADETRRIAEGARDVAITGWFGPPTDAMQAAHRARWDRLAANLGAAGLRVLTRDPDRHPADAQRDGVDGSGTVVLRRDDRVETLFAPDEGAIAGALLRLRGEPGRAVVFVTEGGARSPGDASSRGLATFGALLRERGHPPRPLGDEIGDAAFVVLADPDEPVSGTLAAALADWVDGGGALLLLLEPGRPSGLEAELARWGVTASPTPAVDPSSRDAGTDGSALLSARFGAAPTTRGLRRSVWVPSALTLQSTGSAIDALLYSSPRAEAGAGPREAVLAVRIGLPGGGIVVVADADVFADPAMRRAGNVAFAERIGADLARDAEGLTLPPRATAASLRLSESEALARTAAGFAIVLIPIVIGAFVARRG